MYKKNNSKSLKWIGDAFWAYILLPEETIGSWGGVRYSHFPGEESDGDWACNHIGLYCKPTQFLGREALLLDGNGVNLAVIEKSRDCFYFIRLLSYDGENPGGPSKDKVLSSIAKCQFKFIGSFFESQGGCYWLMPVFDDVQFLDKDEVYSFSMNRGSYPISVANYQDEEWEGVLYEFQKV